MSLASCLRWSLFAMAGVLLKVEFLSAQESFTATRRDEVGFRELDLDEETFLNILSFEQPLESLQEWNRLDNGFRTFLGSTDAEQFIMDQDLKLYAPLSDVVGVRVYGRQAIDLDTSFLFFQIAPEFKIAEHWYASVPLNLSPDKGNSDGGLAFGYRDPSNGIDFLQLSWLRADVFFNDRSQEFEQSRISTPADTLEFQMQVDVGEASTMSLRVAKQLPSRINFVETEAQETFRRLSGRFLYRVNWSDADRSFALIDSDADSEVSRPFFGTDGFAFDGERDYVRVRAEHQHDVESSGVRRWRFGAQFLFLEEDIDQPDRSHDVLRRESTIYVGYRLPVPWLFGADVEGVTFLSRVDSRSRLPDDPERDGSVPLFQGKLNVSMRWALNDRTELVLTPSLGLDQVRWGGGGAQLRVRF